MAALRSGPLPIEEGVKIAKQVASAIHFLHERNIHHGQIGTRTVLLVEDLRERPATAKLANFSRAKLHVDDEAVLATDIFSFGVFLYNLFAKSYSSAGPALNTFSQFSLQQLQDDVTVATLGPLLHSIFSRGVSSAKEVAERCNEVLEPFEERDAHAALASQPAFLHGAQRDDQPTSRRTWVAWAQNKDYE